ncbi:ABC transporter permease [Phascolarctobacterium sp.]|uniref:ABC transporter permease n=1 Tax=Phascolarctobacterium sp. TaxID=2049039 RepID=UPI0038702A81
MIFAEALFPQGSFASSASWQVLLNDSNLTTIRNSLLLGFAVTLLSTVIAAPLAFLLAKTPLGRHSWLDIIFMIPFMTPPYIASMGWILFMQKRGLLEQLCPALKWLSPYFFSFAGLTLVMSLHVFPFMVTILKNAMLNIPSSLLESGAVFGATPAYRMRKIFMPLLTANYVIGALLVFVKTLAEYGTPATLGFRIGFYVFTTDIHRYATVAPIDFGSAATLSSVLIMICLGFWYLQSYITSTRSYNLVSGKGARTASQCSRLLKIIGWNYILLLIFVAIVIPYFSVVSTSLIKLRGYGLAAGNFTLQHYVDLFLENENGIAALWNSVILATSSASLAALLGTIIAVLLPYYSKMRRKLLEATSLLPEMLPGIVLVIGIMLFWNKIYQLLPLYNTLGIMVLAYTVLFLPYTVQYVGSALTQISPSLNWAGRTLGGSPFYVFRRITLPLIGRAVSAGWMMTFIIAFRELVTASLIAPPNTLVVSTFIMSEFEQGSVPVGMAMAVICVLFTTTALICLNRALHKNRG